MKPCLIVTVDTEEEGLWSGRYCRTGNTVENTRGIERFQRLCDQFDIKPTYLVDTPVVEDDRSVEMLRDLQDQGKCEIGAHLHPWCAPPFEEELCDRNSFLCNLPENLQREKLRRLTDRIEGRFARRPTSFRAGRYGLDATGARLLADLGYSVDSSVIPFSDFSSEGGPNYQAAPTEPYIVRNDDLLTAENPTSPDAPTNASGRLLEVPVTVGYSRRNFESADRWRRVAMRRPFRTLRMVGLLDRTGIARRIKLSPEQATAAQMVRLIDLCLERGAPCTVMMFHSTSLIAGMSPYVRDRAQLERFYADVTLTFEHGRDRAGLLPETMTKFAATSTAALNTAQRPLPALNGVHELARGA